MFESGEMNEGSGRWMRRRGFLLASGAAVQKYMDKLAQNEEIVAALANIVIEIYAMESSLLRAQKANAGEARNRMGDAARAYIYDALDRVEKDARTALAATVDGDTLTTQLAVLRRFTKHAAVDTIALRRGIAQAVFAQNRYPFDGR